MKERERGLREVIKQSVYLERDQRRGGLRLGERLEELLVGVLVLEARSLPGLHGLLLTLREDKFLSVARPGAGTAVADPHHDGELRTTGRPDLPLSLTSSALSLSARRGKESCPVRLLSVSLSSISHSDFGSQTFLARSDSTSVSKSQQLLLIQTISKETATFGPNLQTDLVSKITRQWAALLRTFF